MDWKIAYAHHDVCSHKHLCTIADVETSGFEILPASVPGYFELDLNVNGNLCASTDNMYLPCDVTADWKMGENEVVVHIRPTVLEARKFTSPAACNAHKYSYPSLYVRKAPHMFGWDIMPRIVSAGIWKEVQLP